MHIDNTKKNYDGDGIDSKTFLKSEIDSVVYRHTRAEAMYTMKNIIDTFIYKDRNGISRVKEAVANIFDELLDNRDILHCLTDLRFLDDYTFAHSINVCIISIIVGIGLKFNLLRLTELGVGAILHDVGKLKISEYILKKPSKLTVEEFEEVKKHTTYGYEILKNIKNISPASSYIALGHHERCDGSGYPLQLKGLDIHQYARIVAVADVFDALTTDRVYRKKLCRHDAYEYIESLGYNYFDQEIINAFFESIVVYQSN